MPKVPCSEFKTVRQEWDWTNPCAHCDFVFLKSHTGSFRKKCCSGGRFIKKELPENLLYYCRLEDNDNFIKNCYIYNNLLSFGSLGLDKQYNSSYIKTQGGCVTLQGRTYLHHRRENHTKALVFFTNGHKLDEEQDRIFHDLEKVVGPYNMNGDNSNDWSSHFRVINSLRNEQYIVNQLAIEFNTILESMQTMRYEELKVQLTTNFNIRR